MALQSGTITLAADELNRITPALSAISDAEKSLLVFSLTAQDARPVCSMVLGDLVLTGTGGSPSARFRRVGAPDCLPTTIQWTVVQLEGISVVRAEHQWTTSGPTTVTLPLGGNVDPSRAFVLASNFATGNTAGLDDFATVELTDIGLTLTTGLAPNATVGFQVVSSPAIRVFHRRYSLAGATLLDDFPTDMARSTVIHTYRFGSGTGVAPTCAEGMVRSRIEAGDAALTQVSIDRFGPGRTVTVACSVIEWPANVVVTPVEVSVADGVATTATPAAGLNAERSFYLGSFRQTGGSSASTTVLTPSLGWFGVDVTDGSVTTTRGGSQEQALFSVRVLSF